MLALDLSKTHQDLVTTILRKHLPEGCAVYVFGSRARGNAKPLSDLDLLIEGVGPISIDILASLAHDFEECGLPYKVDMVDASAITDSFRQHIAGELRQLI